MSGVSFSDVDSFGGLVELYADDVFSQENVVSSFYANFRKAGANEVEFDGKAWNQLAQFQYNESYASLNDGERLPNALIPKQVFARYKPKLNYSSLELTTFAATRGHKKGRINGKYLEDYIKGTLLSMTSNLDSDALANGRGYRATVVTATPAASSFTVKFSTRLRPGMLLDWYDSTLTTLRGSIAISSRGVDRMARTVYIDPAFGTAAVPAGATADDVLVVYGALAAGEPSDGRGMGGYARITDNSVAYGEISPTTYAAWQAVVLNAGLANPNQEILQQLWDSLTIISGTAPNMGCLNPAWKRGYLQGFLNQRMFTSNTFDTGATSLSWSPVKMGRDESKIKKPAMLDLIEDKNQDPSQFFMWNSEAGCIAFDYGGEQPYLADEDGSEFRFRRNFDSMNGFMRLWGNFVVKQRNAFGNIYNFQVATGAI